MAMAIWASASIVDRTVATFHDAMLLKFRARELPVEPYPHMSILAHRIDLVALTECARILTNSERSREDLLRFTGIDPQRVRVTLLGVSPRFAPSRGEGRGTS